MKRIAKIMGMLTVLLVMILNLSVKAYAEGSVSIESEKNACAVGDSFSITITALSENDSAVPPQINVEFNSNRLSFDNCSVQYGGGNGGLVTISENTATLDFTALSGGDAKITVTATLDEDSTDVQTAEFTMNVEGEDTAAGTDVEAVSEDTGVSSASIDTGDGRCVQAVFASEFMPIMFHKATTQYKGQTVECAQFDMGDLTLLYTTDAAGADGVFCIYNTATGEMSPLKVVMGIENHFIIILDECEGDIPSGYVKSVVNWRGQNLTAYPPQTNGTAFGGLNSEDFFLVYAMSSEGVKGWYQYDRKEETFQRFFQMTSVGDGNVNGGNNGADTKSKSSDGNFLEEYVPLDIQAILLLVFLGLTVILFIVVIALAVRNSGYEEYEYSDDYYEEDYETEPQSRRGVTASSIVDKTMNDEADEDEADEDEDDEEDDDEDEEDDEDNDDENKIEESRSKDIKSKSKSKISETESDEDDEEEFEEEEDEEDEDEEDEDEEDEDDEDNRDDYFDPRWTKRELKEREKQRRKAEKEAAREEKWRLKEEKKARKMRAKGYEEASPMDWSSFGESLSDKKDSRRPTGKSKLPSYMTEELPEEEIEEVSSDSVDDREDDNRNALPPRKMNAPAMSEQREAESAKQFKEDEMRKKQKRLFEQQQRIEEQRRIEEEQYEIAQREEQEKFMLNQQTDDDLDEDFQFEFLEL